MSTRLSFKEVLERRVETPVDLPSRSASTVDMVLRRDGEIERPVDLVRKLKSFGLTLKQSHNLLEEVASGKLVLVRLQGADLGGIIAELAKLGVAAAVAKEDALKGSAAR